MEASLPTEVGRVSRLAYVCMHVSVFPYEQNGVWGGEGDGVIPNNVISSAVLAASSAKK